jgi:hypothetical protein
MIQYKSKIENDKQALMRQIENKNIKEIFYKDLAFMCIDSTFLLHFDSKKFNEEYPEVYKKYALASEISATIRIKEIENKEKVIRDWKALY